MRSSQLKIYIYWYNHLLRLMSLLVISISPFFLPEMCPASSSCVDISDSPVEVSINAAPPNIIYLLDDSGSMDWEMMTSESNGLFQDRYYVFRDSDYDPSNDHNYGTGHSVFNAGIENHWKSQWSGYNKIYYNPNNIYKPWPNMSDADTTNPRSNPVNASPVFHLANIYLELDGDNDDFANSWETATQVGCGQLTAEFEEPGDHDYVKIVLETTGTLTVRTYDTGDCTDTLGRILDSQGNPYRTDEYPDKETQFWTGYETYDDDCGSANFCDHTCRNPDWNFYISLDNVPAGTYYIDVMEYGNNNAGTYLLSIDFTGDCATPPPPPPTAGPVTIFNAHYFTWDDNNTNGEIDDGEIYLVNFEDSDSDGVLDTRKYYKFTASDDVLNSGELIPVSDADVPDNIKAQNRDEDGNPTGFMSFDEELQNFANWFSFYRRRELTAKAAVAFSIDQIDWAQIGFYTINHSAYRQCVLPINVDDNGTLLDETNTLLDKLYQIDSSGYTPLRVGLLNVGRYLAEGDGTNGNMCDSPYASADEGGMCQQSFCIAMTDGYWNGDSPNVGNQDGGKGSPYQDNWYNTLADVAMKYYMQDLCPDLDDVVPINDCDTADWQHMVTYTVSFGVSGTLQYPWSDSDNDGEDDDPCFLNPSTPSPSWPNPSYGDSEKIDDLWHAAVNGRGLFFNAADPAQLVNALNSITSNLLSRLSSGASVAVNGEKLSENSVVYQTVYIPDGWTGDLIAYPMDAETGAVKREEDDILWKAAEKLELQDWDTGRIIITSNGSGTGIPFRYSNLTADQKTLLEDNPDLVDYIRGKNVAGLRNRSQKLGDIVHSAPTILGNFIYVGGNDGMLHVFNKDDGTEKFAFIPSQVFPNLKDLAQNNYSHKFFVDLTPTVLDTGNGTILVGGFGAGGKGYFALDVSQPESVSEQSASSLLMWELANDEDLGYSFSRAAIVRSYSSEHPWVVIFGNGYNSQNGAAVLFIVDAFTGAVIKKIDTQATGCNGLSTPAVTDIDGDFIGDFVYAGDLQGNLWKFDITSEDASQWHSSYSNNGVPVPLFKAVGQPITAKPDVMKHCTSFGYMVLFGTGKFMGESDKNDLSMQTLYGIWDYGDKDDPTEYVGSFDASSGSLTSPLENVELIEQTVTRNGEIGLLSSTQPNWNTVPDDDNDTEHPNPQGTENDKASVGWYLNLGSLADGERLIRDVIIRNGNGIFITTAPDSSPCSGGGKSALYEIDACSGGKTRHSVFNPGEDPQNPPDENFPNVIYEDVLIYPPKILRLPNTSNPPQEEKLLSTSQGTILRINERAAWRGFSYWKEW